MKRENVYSNYVQQHSMPENVSFEELEMQIEQSAREEEADNIVLAEDKRLND